MMNPPNKTGLLQQIAAIAAMERGTLSAYTFKERSNDSGPYHKLQHWQDGKNHTRYVSADELPSVQAAVAGYAQIRQLAPLLTACAATVCEADGHNGHRNGHQLWYSVTNRDNRR
jgi:hypothetical protein